MSGIVFGNSDGGGAEAVSALNNGLTLNGSTGQLGGTLISNTTINTNNLNLDIGDPTHLNGILRVEPGVLQFLIENGTYKLSILAETAAGGNLFFIATLGGVYSGLNVSTSSIVLQDAINNKGAVYAADYSVLSKSNPRWIPDNGYVTALLSGYSPIVSQSKTTGITATQTLMTFVIPVTGLYTVDWSALMTAFTSGSNALAFSYTNKNGVVTALIGTTRTSVGSSSGSPAVIWVLGGSTFTATSTVTGTNSSDIAVSLLQIG